VVGARADARRKNDASEHPCSERGVLSQFGDNGTQLHLGTTIQKALSVWTISTVQHAALAILLGCILNYQ
jgi:hypothetical protein